MRSILFLVPDWQYHGRARQASLLASAVPRDRFAVRAFSLNGPGPFAEPLRQANVPSLGKRGRWPFALEASIGLGRVLRTDRPELLHVWGLVALRALGPTWWLKRCPGPSLVVSLQAAELRHTRLGWRDRFWLKRAEAIVVAGDAERASLIAAGLPAAKIHVIRPGVSLPTAPAANAEFRLSHAITETDCLFMGVGHFNEPERFLDALWAFEVVRGVEPTMKLLIIGDGSFRQRAANRLYYSSREAMGVQFLQARPDAANLLSQADVVLIGHRRWGGTYAVLEGMAAGRPVVAPQLTHLAGFIHDGETGFLVEPANPPAIARVASRLLKDAVLRERVGAAARADIAANYRIEEMAARFAELYDDVLRG